MPDFAEVPLSSRHLDRLLSKEVEPVNHMLHHKVSQHQDRATQTAKASSIGIRDTAQYTVDDTLAGAMTWASGKRESVLKHSEETIHRHEQGDTNPLISNSLGTGEIKICSVANKFLQNEAIKVKKMCSEVSSTTYLHGNAVDGIQIERGKSGSAMVLRNGATDHNDSGTENERDAETSLRAPGLREANPTTSKFSQTQYLLRFSVESIDPISLPLCLITGFALSLNVYIGDTLVPLPRRICAATTLWEGGKRKNPDTILNEDDFASMNMRSSIGVLTYGNTRINAERRVSAGSQAEYLAIDPLAVSICLALTKQR